MAYTIGREGVSRDCMLQYDDVYRQFESSISYTWTILETKQKNN